MKTLLPTLLLILSLCQSAFAQLTEKDAPGAKDHPALKRFSGTVLVNRSDTNFDEAELVVGKPDETAVTTAPSMKLEGHISRLVYLAPQSNNPLELERNYRDSVLAGGGEVLFECNEAECGVQKEMKNGSWLRNWIFPAAKISNQGRDVANCTLAYGADSPFGPGLSGVRYFVAKLAKPEGAHVAVLSYTIAAPYNCTGYNGYNTVVVQIIEPKAIGNSMVTVTAADIFKAFEVGGRVAIYGIYFDTNKTEIKPDSKTALDEIAKVMLQQPALKVHIVGHTDNVGTLSANLDLSKRRAVSVAQALSKNYGIVANRLTPNGVASLAPVASNTTDEGRAKNRRVELVPQ